MTKYDKLCIKIGRTMRDELIGNSCKIKGGKSRYTENVIKMCKIDYKLSRITISPYKWKYKHLKNIFKCCIR